MSLHSDDVFVPTHRIQEETRVLLDEQAARCKGFEDAFIETISGRKPEDVIIVTSTGYEPDDYRFSQNRHFYMVDVAGICQEGGSEEYFKKYSKQNDWGGFQKEGHIHSIENDGLRAWVESVPFTPYVKGTTPYDVCFKACVKRAKELGYTLTLTKSYWKYDVTATKGIRT